MAEDGQKEEGQASSSDLCSIIIGCGGKTYRHSVLGVLLLGGKRGANAGG